MLEKTVFNPKSVVVFSSVGLLKSLWFLWLFLYVFVKYKNEPISPPSKICLEDLQVLYFYTLNNSKYAL